MALTLSTMMPLGTTAPDFALPDAVSGQTMDYAQVAGPQGTVVMFICNHCPFVVYVREELVSLAAQYKEKGFGFVAISSNDVSAYPDDSPEKMRLLAQSMHFSFPYLYDESQEVARAYDAACTPDLYVFGPDRTLAYRGQLDASRPGNNINPNGQDLRAALDAMLAGQPVSADQRPSAGCNIKWKS